MSYRGRQHGQRTTSKRFETGNDQIFETLPAVEAWDYDPATDVACQQIKVPYGPVFVGGQPDNVRSHEVHLDNMDRSGFNDSALLSHERRIERENRAWSESYNRGPRTSQRAKELRKGLHA